MKTVIYARYSSQLQNSRSIEDQVAVCRERAEREGWTIIDIFTDFATSGAAGIREEQRLELAAMLAQVQRGGLDQVLAESTDRLARHQGDSHSAREQLNFYNTRLFTLSDGVATEINGTFKRLMDAQFRKELGAKIKRDQRESATIGAKSQASTKRSPIPKHGWRRSLRCETLSTGLWSRPVRKGAA